MGDFLRLLLDSIQYLWPFRIVQEWEQGGVYVFGRFWKVVGPGCYPIAPFFMEIRTVSVVQAIVTTGKQDITLRDGKTLYFAATVTAQVDDFNLAVNTVDDFKETTQELMASVLADRLMDVEAKRLEPEGRRRLQGDLNRWVADEAKLFGITTSKLRFTNFVINTKTFRILQANEGLSGW